MVVVVAGLLLDLSCVCSPRKVYVPESHRELGSQQMEEMEGFLEEAV